MKNSKIEGKKFDKSGFFLLDGAMGTILQSSGIESSECPEMLNISKPDLISGIHKSYLDAGSDIILTNTFGANRKKLLQYGLEDKLYDINRAAIKLARQVSRDDSFVGCSIGPTGKFVEPIGEMSFEEIFENYKEQISICMDVGIDLIVLESFGDIKEIRAALIATRELAPEIPVLAMMTFQEDCRTVLGTPPESAAIILEALGADFIGANCSLGPDLLLSIIKKMGTVSDKPFVVQPNAGMPELKENKTIYPATPEYMAEYSEKFISNGVAIIGGCCGTTPEHIKKTAQIVKKIKKIFITRSISGTHISSRTNTVKIGSGLLTKRVGERINPTGKSYLIEELKNASVSKILEMANEQVKNGADILDLNVSAAEVDETFMMSKVVKAVQRSVNVPLMIDSQNTSVIEAGLKAADGKVIVNSITGEDEKLNAILPLVKKYGAAVLGLTIDKKGIPKTAEERVNIAEKIIKAAASYNIPEEDIIIDCLALAVSAEQDQVSETLKAIKIIKEKYNVSTILGISNVSFGLPERSYINAAFLTMAVQEGLDAAILNPTDPLISKTLLASDVLLSKDKGAKVFLKNKESKRKKGDTSKDKEKINENSVNTHDKIYQCILQGDKEGIGKLIKTALNEKLSPNQISNNTLIPALKEVGDLFEKKIYFLPQMILSAETMQIAFDILKDNFEGKNEIISKGKIVMASVKGDIHDIGKNIVITMLKNYGYEIFDMGKSVPAEKIIECAVKNKVDIIGLSALMTTTMVEMEMVINLIKKEGLSFYTIVGGAVVTSKYANIIGADAYAKDALDAVKKVNSLCLSDN